MNTTTHNEIHPANNAGVPPAPPKAHQKSVCARHENLRVRHFGQQVLLSDIRDSETKGFSLVFRDEELGVFVFEQVKNGRVYRKAFSGKRKNADFNYWFRTLEAAEAHTESFVNGVRQHLARITENRARDAKNRKAHDVKVGDVFMSTWGYEQTNVDYFEVTKTIGTCTVEIRRIAAKKNNTDWMRGDCVPHKGAYIGTPTQRRITVSGNEAYIRIRSCSIAHRIVPKIIGGMEVFTPADWTAYA
jgi:hypothetical protein